MKILDLTEFYSPTGGGVRTYLEAKRRHLGTRTGVDHVLVVTGPRHDLDPGPPRVHVVRGPEVPGSPGYHFMLRPRRIRRIVRRERPDVIELGSHFLAPWVVRGLAGACDAVLVGFYHTDVIGVLADHGLRSLPAPLRRRGVRLVEAYVRAAYRPCELCVASTESAARSLRSVVDVPVDVVPLGVDPDLFHPGRRDPAVRARLRGRSGGPVLVYAGRLAREKELETVVQGLGELHARTGARCVMIGEGHMRGRLESFARTRPELLEVRRFESDRERLATLYASADLYVAPGPYETFGLAVLEAMACGLPVAAVDHGALAGRLGGRPWARLFRQGDPADFVEAAAVLLAEEPAPRDDARRDALALAWDRTFDRLVSLYRDLSGLAPERSSVSSSDGSGPAD